MIHLVTGGARSGKSTWVVGQAEAATEGPLTFVATAEALDEDMTARIERHRLDRSERWSTVEEPLGLAARLPALAGDAIVVDCLTMWISNLLFALEARGGDAAVEAEIDTFVDALTRVRAPTWIVTNEVGLGIVPADALSRRYRDLLGRCNQRVAARADRVTMLVSGLPLRLK